MKLVRESVPETTLGQSETHSSSTLISTKLDIPPLKSRMLQRKGLLERLMKSNDSRLILISGEAGSGKTSLACQWIDQARLTAAWCTLDSDDNNLDRCMRYLLTALSKIDKGLEPVIRPWLQSSLTISIREITPVLVQHYMNAGEDLYLILDDYHLISNTVTQEAVFYFLSHFPSRLHLVILTRYSLPFSVSSLRMREQMLEITSGDLRLTAEETEQFFIDIMSCNLSEKQIEEAFRWTEGWIGGIQLYWLAFKNNAAHQNDQVSADTVYQWTTDYLINEVMAVQEEKIRRFLLITCILDRFNVDVCREITGFADAGEILDHVYRNNLFLVPLDLEGGWYRYHNLFAEALRRRRAVESIEGDHAIHCKASLWFARNGWAEDALRHAFATHDLEFAADMLEDLAPGLVDRYELLSVQKWLNRIPKEMRGQRALLMLYEGRLFLETMHVAKTKMILDCMEIRKEVLFARYSGVKRTNCEFFFRLLRMLLNIRNPQKEDSDELTKNCCELVPQIPTSPIDFKIGMAIHYVTQGKMRPAIDALREVEWLPTKLESPIHSMHWFGTLAMVKAHSGCLRQLEDVVDEATTYLVRKELYDTPLRFFISVKRAWLYFYKNDLVKAEELAGESLLYAEYAGPVANRLITLDAAILTMWIHKARGNLDEALQILHRVRPLASSDQVWLRLVEALIVFITVLQGDREMAVRWLAQRRTLTVDPLSHILEYVECEIYAALLYHLGRFQEASTILANLKESGVAGGLGDFVLRIDIFSSAVFAAMGQHEKAKIHLEQALTFAEREGYIISFIPFAQFIMPLLRQIIDADVSSRFIATILDACVFAGKGNSVGSTQGSNVHHILTDRELEILGFIIQGYKNREIAEKTFISLHTVKTHVRHILEKLNVETRVQAIFRANELKLFGDRQESLVSVA